MMCSAFRFIAKMMWALAYSETREEFETLFCTPVGKDQL